MSYKVGEIPPFQGGAPDAFDRPPPYSEPSAVSQLQTVETAYLLRNNEAERRAAEDRDTADIACDACCIALCAILCVCLLCDS